MAEIDFITHYDSRSPVAEAYRAIRTNLQFSGAGKTLKTIVFTSAIPNEGKSTTVANLAITIGQDDKKSCSSTATCTSPSSIAVSACSTGA